MISIDKALEQLLSSIQLVSAIHPELRSDRDDPAVDKSAMDGYAVRAAEAQAGAQLQVSQKIMAGAVGQPLQPGHHP
ncbi:MAG: hypothetical protein ACO25G_04430 [Holophagaceae bacterium]